MNPIFVDSTLVIESPKITTLCFVDGLYIPKSKYALENHELTLYTESRDYISVFYTSRGKTYNYSVFLSEDGIIIGDSDINGSVPRNITAKRLMVFANGALLQKTDYTILDGGHISLNISYPDKKTATEISIFVSDDDMASGNIACAPGDKIELGYNIDTTMVFINGKKVKPTSISKEGEAISIMEEYTFGKDIVEFYAIPNATSLNFEGSQGYLTYGPFDDNKTKIPLYYDTIAAFDDIATILIDNVRKGMYIRETNGIGLAMLVDDNYEQTKIKAIQLAEFSKSTLTTGEYYIEVPSYKSITDYLSKYDQSKRFLPEVLTVFQRLLIDEFRDSLDRINNLRNIKKVDSVNINRLIKLMGFNLDIKKLNLKQRRELLEELTEFYRIVGTIDSYNFFNIIQDSTRLVRIEQLFTPLDNRKKTDNITYSYKYDLSRNGIDYKIGERYLIDKTNISVVIADIEESGAISAYDVSVYEGTIEYNNVTGNLIPTASGAQLAITSVANYWNYDITVSASDIDSLIGVPLYNSKYDGSITINKNNSENGILNKDSYVASVTSGEKWLSLSNEPLCFENADGATLSVRSSNIDTYPSDVFEIIKEEPTNSEKTFVLTPGVYQIELFGGGGAGGVESHWVIDEQNEFWLTGRGGAGATSTPTIETIIVEKKTTCTYKIGAGGLTKSNGGNGGDGGSGKGNNNVDINVGGAGGGGGFPTYVLFSRKVLLNNGKASTNVLCSQGGGGGGGGGASFIGAGNGGGGGGGYYYYDTNKKIIQSFAGQNGAGAQQNGRNGASATMFPNIHSGGGGYGVNDINETQLEPNTKGGVGGGAGGGGGGLSTGGYVTNLFGERNGCGGGGAGGCPNAGGGGGGGRILGGNTSKQVGENASNHFTNPKKQFNYYGNEADIQWGVGGAPNQNGQSGAIRIRQVKLQYDGNINFPTDTELTLRVGDVVKTSGGEFQAKVLKVNDNSASVQLTPSQGDIYYNQDFSFVTNASITISSIPARYKYNHIISGNMQYYCPGMILHEGIENDQSRFSIIVESVNEKGEIESSTILPQEGADKIEIPLPDGNISNTWAEHGSNAQITITSKENSQKNSERTYVDFYRKDEYPGANAEPHKEYRLPKEDYGSTGEGSEMSPYPWLPQGADIDYGLVTDTPENSESISYGLVTDKIKGQWVEWWTWDRPRNAYATNHVEVEINISAGENYDEVVERFYRQFYNMASTVLYIHRLVTVFHFGNNMLQSVDSQNDFQNISLGIMTAPNAVYERYFYSSDPRVGRRVIS